MKIFLLIFLLLLSLPGFGQEDDEETIKDLEADRLKTSRAAIEIDKSRQELENKTTDFAEKLKEMGYSHLNAASLFDDKVQLLVQNALKESALRHESPELIRAMIMGKVKGKPLEKVFQKFPKLVDISVDVLRDREALPALMKIFTRKEDLKTYGYYWLGLLVLGFIIRKKLFSSEWSFFKRLFMRTAFSLTMTTISLTIFYQMFTSELGPLVSIIKRHL